MLLVGMGEYVAGYLGRDLRQVLVVLLATGPSTSAVVLRCMLAMSSARWVTTVCGFLSWREERGLAAGRRAGFRQR